MQNLENEATEAYNRMFSDPRIDDVIKRIKDGSITRSWFWESDPDKVYLEAMEREKLANLREKEKANDK